MNFKQLSELSISKYRLDDSISGTEEKKTLEFLLQNTMANNQNNFDSIKEFILYMNKYGTNYRLLTDKEKKVVLALDPKTVDVVIATLFQWLGTSVGQYCLKEILKQLDEVKLKNSNKNKLQYIN
jgi:archaellum biogenesis ATPase FlaH